MVRDSTILFAIAAGLLVAFAFLLAGMRNATDAATAAPYQSYIFALLIVGLATATALLGAISQRSREGRE